MSGAAYQPVANQNAPPTPGAVHYSDRTLGTFDARYQQQNASTNSLRDGHTADQDLYPPSRPWSAGSPEPRVQSFYEKMDDPGKAKPVWMNPTKPEKRRSGCLGFLGRPCTLVIIILVVVGTAIGVPLGFYVGKGKSNSSARLPDGNTTQISAVVPPTIPGWRPMVDPATPTDVYNKTALEDPNTPYDLVFSDEFDTDGRSFYPGDDPYWEAVDLHYWQTGNKEWYDPKAVTTSGGALVITLSSIDDLNKQFNHNLSYTGGMIQTWNQFCFTGGRVEAAVTMPGPNNAHGLWPAVWTMGNLGRAGFGGSLEGMWPYTYEACDRGTLKNQALPGETLHTVPNGAAPLSALPGQKLSACTCQGEDHPGPIKDGKFVGRSAPEIDIFEATAGAVSQSGQWAPFNFDWKPIDPATNFHIPNATITEKNTYLGGPLQQAISSVTQTNKGCWEAGPGANGCFSVYGFEYQPGFDGAYITWMSDNVVSWRMDSAAAAADTQVGIEARPVTNEPLYLIANLGISDGFGAIEYDKLTFPVTMKIDWIRVYQPRGKINIGCDPADWPTQDYINKYPDAYLNPNYTVWAPTTEPEQNSFNKPFPKNSLIDGCT